MSAVNSENESIGGSEVIDVCSSDAELPSENLRTNAASVASNPSLPGNNEEDVNLAAGASGAAVCSHRDLVVDLLVSRWQPGDSDRHRQLSFRITGGS